MKIQTKKGSILETCINTGVGYFIALASQIVIFPIFGIYTSIKTNLWIGFWFTVISIVRGFFIRRLFNYLSERRLQRV